jgi:Putative peptidoglycan binding domain
VNTSKAITWIIGLILIIALMSYGYSRYTRHQRYSQLAQYDYVPSALIDYSYYDKQVLQTYYTNCDRLTEIAHEVWMKHGIDVRKERKETDGIQSSIHRYQSMLVYTKQIEARLVESQDLKTQGLSNEVIELVLDKGITIGAVEAEKDKMAALQYLKGKNVGLSSKPAEIWELQKLLNANEYNIAINGIYNPATDSALSDFQLTHGLYVSHSCDDITLMKLAE